MSYHRDTQKYKPTEEILLINDEKRFPRVNLKELRKYALMQSDPLASEAYILSKRFNLDQNYAKKSIEFLGYDRAIEFTELFFKYISDGRIDYLSTLKVAAEKGFGIVTKDLSILEQEVMNFQNKFGIEPVDREVHLYLNNLNSKTKKARMRINPHEIDYRGNVEDSSHYFEHFDTTNLDRQGD